MSQTPSELVQKDRQFVTALSRGLSILRCFDATRPSLSIAEIVRLTGLPQPTVWRLCHTLITDGYLVQQGRQDRLRPGVPILGLGFAAMMATPIAELAYERMNAIAVKYQGSVSLGTRDGASMIYLQRCQGSAIILRDMSIGSRVPLLTSATGWAYLAGLEPGRREATLREARQIEQTLFDDIWPKLQAALAEYADRGYLVNLGSLHPQINAVAVPVISVDGQKVLGLSAGGIHTVFTKKALGQVAQELKTLAIELRAVLTTQRNIL